MIARDLAEPYPHVTTDDRAVDAVRLVAEHNLAALLVLESDGAPYAVVPGSQLVRQLLPEYVMEDPLLAAVIDDRHADSLTEDLAGKTVAQWIPGRSFKPAFVGPEAGILQIAALMARTHVPLVAVIDRDDDGRRLVGVVSAASLMRHLLDVGGGA
ncbi:MULTISPECIES: CBS domain-containing protein [Streptomyces]|uniref:CBS domain-containing protein n=1 Tax=Streptomyces TaxID=1883 RepID=UPI002255AD77|nr:MULTISPECIES: CBS domain-containing protein [Streptomyces]MCX5274888.1 CBS domain-containing protein [Streptomyces virginiae]WSR13487.1 CBS domain-containing protein [Streptomyces sp. NBC_01207]